MNEFGLEDRNVIVTGAARGIGREIATTLARAGARIAVVDYDRDEAEVAVAALRQETGGQHLALEVDVRDPTSVRALATEVASRWPSVDVLVNNAGIARNTPSEDVTDEEWRDVMAVNLDGVFFMAREFGRGMLTARRGTIVNIASMSGLVVNKPQPQAHYNASKAAVIMLTRSLAAEWADRGVRVNSVSPGYIGTDMTKRGLENPEWRRTWLAMTPQNRVGAPHDVALAVQYLASDAAGYVTGENLVVDGGYTVW